MEHLIPSDSPLREFDNTVSGGVSARFTLNIDEVSIDGAFSKSAFIFKVSENESLRVKNLLKQIQNLKNALNLFPSTIGNILSSELTSFSFLPEEKRLSFKITDIPQIVLIPTFLQVDQVKFSLDATIGHGVTVNVLKLVGEWTVDTVHVPIQVVYDGKNSLFQIKAVTTGTPLNIGSLISNVGGIADSIAITFSSVHSWKYVHQWKLLCRYVS